MRRTGVPKHKDVVDPFAQPRDQGEARAASVVRDYWIRNFAPAQIFRQDDVEAGYALIVQQPRGERLITIPALHEADFTFHGNPGSTTEELAAFISQAVSESAASCLRLPLLSRRQALALRRALAMRLPQWRIAAALAAVAPFARKSSLMSAKSNSLRRALARAERDGITVETTALFPNQEIRALHRRRWGDNRDDKFFEMIRTLLEERCAELITARASDGRLVAAQLDILGTGTRHYYYSTSDPERVPGSGTAVLAASWRRFADTGAQRIYSFGRGSEHYKYRYATACRELYELRGFYAPRAGRR